MNSGSYSQMTTSCKCAIISRLRSELGGLRLNFSLFGMKMEKAPVLTRFFFGGGGGRGGLGWGAWARGWIDFSSRLSM